MVAKNIAREIEVIITPEEESRIEKVPTDNLEAYDHYLKGLDLLYQQKEETTLEAIAWFKKAIESDNEFALAYADMAISYYYLDIFKDAKSYAAEINHYADQALLFDPQLPQSLIAKAFYYMYERRYEKALPYLEKALEYNPNSALVINTLSDFYANYLPNSGKYLMYALKGIQLDIAANDSSTASFIYLHVSNALIQNGFTDEAEKYINKSLLFNPENIYSQYVRDYILYAQTPDLSTLNERLLKTFKKDTTRLDVVQEVAKSYYYLRDFQKAYAYYNAFLEVKEAYGLDIYPGENAKIAETMARVGKTEEAKELFEVYKVYADKDKSLYKNISLAAYYSFRNEKSKAIEHLKLFAHQDNFHYWTILFLEMDPLMDNIKDLPEFKGTMNKIEEKFWKQHKKIKKELIEQKLL
jgi:tetratricopeptide (TPR) repeat protein